MGPFPETKRKNIYIIMLTDVFSNYSVAKSSIDKSASSVLGLLLSTCCMFGMWKIIQSDQGKEFVNEVIKGFNERMGAKVRIGSAYHPQSQGKIEKTNGTIKAMLKKLVDVNGTDWDLYLDAVLFSHRTGINTSAKFSPYEILFGRKPLLPVDVAIPVGREEVKEVEGETMSEQTVYDATVTLMKEITNLHKQVKQNIENAQKKQVIKYNKRKKIDEHIADRVVAGAEAYLRDCRVTGTSMGNAEYSGPYTIEEVNTNTVVVSSTSTNKRQNVAINRVKLVNNVSIVLSPSKTKP